MLCLIPVSNPNLPSLALSLHITCVYKLHTKPGTGNMLPPPMPTLMITLSPIISVEHWRSIYTRSTDLPARCSAVQYCYSYLP
ncbi:hypothetical protein BAE44_0024435 [Dichanthelium oligosanthes]|uniref:Uncharacterized protein n=1 Tax=Dichanthelium oligosanthes TaxID=888268 RepID=A0A1E5UNX4_9POAL|nr:hypothetical protein BAE44_0024435 [Dichanthelium oligosanthes]